MKDQKIKICGQDIQLKIVDPGIFSENGMGRTSIMTGEILIKDKMPDSIIDSTIIHEILHYILDTNSIHGVFNNNKIENEAFVSIVANCLHSFIRDNKDLIKEMSER